MKAGARMMNVCAAAMYVKRVSSVLERVSVPRARAAHARTYAIWMAHAGAYGWFAGGYQRITWRCHQILISISDIQIGGWRGQTEKSLEKCSFMIRFAIQHSQTHSPTQQSITMSYTVL